MGKEVRVGKIECIENPTTCGRLQVQGFPTLKVLADGVAYPFVGGNRELSTLQAFAGGGYKSVKGEPLPGGADKTATRLVVEKESDEHKETILTAENFPLLVSSGRWLVAATAPWCGHCKALAPALNFFASQKDLSFQTASINCDEDSSLCRALGVQSFPTLFVVEQGHFVTMPSGAERSVQALQKFAESEYATLDKKALGGSNKIASAARRGLLLLLDEKTFDEATARGAWLMGFTCKSAQCKAMETALNEVQKSYSLHLQVGLVDCDASAALCREHKITATPTVVLLYLDRGFLFSGEHTSANYVLFVGEGFKTAPAHYREHLGLKRRLTFANLSNRDALLDFAHQNRYLLVVCVGAALLVWGIIWGSALATSPASAVYRYRQFLQQQQQQQQQQGGGSEGFIAVQKPATAAKTTASKKK